jgi:hypothetical protein
LDRLTCRACEDKCGTCAGRPDLCTSCPSYMRFDAAKFDCVQVCKPNEQIFYPAQGYCASCHSNCITCNGNVNNCTTCKKGYALNNDNMCRTTCKGPEKVQVTDNKGVKSWITQY